MRVFRSPTNTICIEHYDRDFLLDSLVAEEVDFNGLPKVIIKHATMGVWDDENLENNFAVYTFLPYSDYTDQNDTPLASTSAETVTALNAILSS